MPKISHQCIPLPSFWCYWVLQNNFDSFGTRLIKVCECCCWWWDCYGCGRLVFRAHTWVIFAPILRSDVMASFRLKFMVITELSFWFRISSEVSCSWRGRRSGCWLIERVSIYFRDQFNQPLFAIAIVEHNYCYIKLLINWAHWFCPYEFHTNLSLYPNNYLSKLMLTMNIDTLQLLNFGAYWFALTNHPPI